MPCVENPCSEDNDDFKHTHQAKPVNYQKLRHPSRPHPQVADRRQLEGRSVWTTTFFFLSAAPFGNRRGGAGGKFRLLLVGQCVRFKCRCPASRRTR